MKSLLVGTLAFYFLSVALAQDAVCSVKESTDLDVVIRDGDTFKYKTSPKRKYGDNIECLVTYELDASCAEMELRCKKINIKNKDVEDCTDGDKLVITNDDEETETVCGKKKKFVFKSSSNMVVEFTSDGKKRGAGAKGCVVTCTKAASAATATAAPTTAAPTTAAPTTAAPTTAAPTTAAPTTGPGAGGAAYSKAWLRGDGPGAHVHEGIQLADKSGWVAIGELLPEEGQSAQNYKVMIRAVDGEAGTLWTSQIGDDHKQSSKSAYSVGLSLVEGGDSLYAGVGLWQKSSSRQAPAVMSLDPSTGSVQWTTVLGQGQSGHGAVRSCIMDGQDVVCVGYVGDNAPGFKFVADEAKPVVWRLDSDGVMLTEKILSVEGVGQLAKVRTDPAGGFVACSTGWAVKGGQDVNVVAVVKLSASLNIEWSKTYGKAGGNSQVFDMLVDNDGNYLLGGHTTVGQGVVNWDYLALKVNSQTKAEMWRRTYGQPRGFDARYIHDEMYGVALDNGGNYLLLGGSGDEYSYSATGTGQWSGWASDTWGSYLVVVSPGGQKLYENFYGKKGGNNAGEWLSYDQDTGDIMVYTDSDTEGGFGFLKLIPTST